MYVHMSAVQLISDLLCYKQYTQLACRNQVKANSTSFAAVVFTADTPKHRVFNATKFV
jgi:hypothetical protein